MNKLLEFISNNYLIFVIIAVFLLFSLIGYIFEKKSSNDIKIKSNKESNVDNNIISGNNLEDKNENESVKMNIETL